MENLILINGNTQLEIGGFDLDKILLIRIEGFEVEDVYLSPNQTNELVNNLIERLKEIGEYAQSKTVK